MSAMKMGGWLERWKERAEELERQVFALYLATRHPETPWYAKAVALAVAAYSLSPIDLIPDFIPVLGALDDLLIVPAGVLLVIRLVPRPVMADCQLRAGKMQEEGAPEFRWMGVVVAALWLAALVYLILWIRGMLAA